MLVGKGEEGRGKGTDFSVERSEGSSNPTEDDPFRIITFCLFFSCEYRHSISQTKDHGIRNFWCSFPGKDGSRRKVSDEIDKKFRRGVRL